MSIKELNAFISVWTGFAVGHKTRHWSQTYSAGLFNVLQEYLTLFDHVRFQHLSNESRNWCNKVNLTKLMPPSLPAESVTEIALTMFCLVCCDSSNNPANPSGQTDISFLSLPSRSRQRQNGCLASNTVRPTTTLRSPAQSSDFSNSGSAFHNRASASACVAFPE